MQVLIMKTPYRVVKVVFEQSGDRTSMTDIFKLYLAYFRPFFGLTSCTLFSGFGAISSLFLGISVKRPCR